MKNAGYSAEKVDFIIKKFNWFVDAPEFKLEDFKTSDEDYSWLQIRKSIDGFEEIGDIALRLLCSAVSKASAERTIKKQRIIHNKRTMRSKKPLLDARMILTSY